MTTVTRFAPSPTGDLHIGAVRTALYAWLYAKHKSGRFILRIEDTDRERSTKESIDVILQGMEWLGLDYGGDPNGEPYYQTKRFARYDAVLKQLLEQDLAYKCYCSKERVEKLRIDQLARKEKPRYDGFCRDKNYYQKEIQDQGKNLVKTSTEPFVIRFKNPLQGVVTFNDAVRGQISVQNQELDDLVIKRSDGYPTYNFAVVVDDKDMEITDVIRGEDHIANTPRQINIFKALNATPPRYAHVPMILGNDGKKLSKRHGALSILQYKEDGYLREALLNYLVRLGWSAGDKEVFSIEEMITLFSLDNISKAPAAFDPEKLLWLNQHYLKTLPVDHIAEILLPYYKKANIDCAKDNGPDLKDIVLAFRERAKTLNEIVEKSKYFYEDDIQIKEDVAKKHVKPEILLPLEEMITLLQQISTWNKDNIKSVVDLVIKKFNLKMPELAQPIRIAVTGDINSPSIDVTLALIGKDRTLKRMSKALSIFKKYV